MSTQNVKKFYDQVGKNKLLKEEMSKIDAGLKGKNVQPADLSRVAKEKIIPIAKKNGYDFSENDLFNYFEEKLKVLDIADLDQISGGVSQKAAGIGLGAIMLLGLGGTAAMNVMKGQIGDSGTSISQSAPQDNQNEKIKEKRAEAYPDSKSNNKKGTKRVAGIPQLEAKKAEKIERTRPKSKDRNETISRINGANGTELSGAPVNDNSAKAADNAANRAAVNGNSVVRNRQGETTPSIQVRPATLTRGIGEDKNDDQRRNNATVNINTTTPENDKEVPATQNAGDGATRSDGNNNRVSTSETRVSSGSSTGTPDIERLPTLPEESNTNTSNRKDSTAIAPNAATEKLAGPTDKNAVGTLKNDTDQNKRGILGILRDGLERAKGKVKNHKAAAFMSGAFLAGVAGLAALAAKQTEITGSETGMDLWTPGGIELVKNQLMQMDESQLRGIGLEKGDIATVLEGYNGYSFANSDFSYAGEIIYNADDISFTITVLPEKVQPQSVPAIQKSDSGSSTSPSEVTFEIAKPEMTEWINDILTGTVKLNEADLSTIVEEYKKEPWGPQQNSEHFSLRIEDTAQPGANSTAGAAEQTNSSDYISPHSSSPLNGNSVTSGGDGSANNADNAQGK